MAKDIERESERTVQSSSEAEEGNGNMETHIQVMDSYREGTIDARIEHSKNGVDEIPRTGYEEMFDE